MHSLSKESRIMAPRPDEKLCSTCNASFGPLIRDIITKVIQERSRMRSMLARSQVFQSTGWPGEYYETYLQAHHEFLKVMQTLGTNTNLPEEEQGEMPEEVLSSLLRI